MTFVYKEKPKKFFGEYLDINDLLRKNVFWPFDRFQTDIMTDFCPAFTTDIYHVYRGFYYSQRPKKICGTSLSNNKLLWVVRSWPFDHSLTDFWPIFYFLPVILLFVSCKPPNFKTAIDQPNFYVVFYCDQ